MKKTNASNAKSQATLPVISRMYVVLNVMNMVISQWTVQTEYHHHACLPTIGDKTPMQGATPDPLLGIATKTIIRIAGQDHSHTLADIAVIVATTHSGVTPGHITDATTEALHDIATPAPIIIAMTHHTKDQPHVEVPQLIPEIAANPDCAPPIKQVRTPHFKSSSITTRTTVQPQDRKQRRVTIDDPQSDYYSSYDTSSDSEDDLN